MANIIAEKDAELLKTKLADEMKNPIKIAGFATFTSQLQVGRSAKRLKTSDSTAIAASNSAQTVVSRCPYFAARSGCEVVQNKKSQRRSGFNTGRAGDQNRGADSGQIFGRNRSAEYGTRGRASA